MIGLELGLAERLELVSGDVSLWLENDASWIEGHENDGGVFVGVVRASGNDLTFEPTLAVNGVGLRVGKLQRPAARLRHHGRVRRAAHVSRRSASRA